MTRTNRSGAAFSAALSALNVNYEEAASLLRHGERTIKKTMVTDWARGKSRIPDDVWAQLGAMFETIEMAADEIIADQAEADGGNGLLPLQLDVETIALDHPKMRAAAAARAMFVLGPRLLTIIDE